MNALVLVQEEADLERRFGGLRRLYGEAGYAKLRSTRIAIVGLGGVGSWTAEALARCGVASLVLIDLDHVAESNINRQIQALGATVGQSKAAALRDRIADIHPGCDVRVVEEFVEEANWPALLPCAVDVVIDACDQVLAKIALATWALREKAALIVVGAAGGKQLAHKVAVDDLAAVTHDPLLASVRRHLRKQLGAPHWGSMGVPCVYSRESVRMPQGSCDIDGNLSCHGYGSSVTVTATFGMVAAGEALQQVLQARAP